MVGDRALASGDEVWIGVFRVKGFGNEAFWGDSSAHSGVARCADGSVLVGLNPSQVHSALFGLHGLSCSSATPLGLEGMWMGTQGSSRRCAVSGNNPELA